MKEKVLILDNIRSVYNVGSIFRTADAAGVSKIYLCGVTPAPVDRFGRKRKDVAKVALGAEESVGWERVEAVEEVTANLKGESFEVVAVEQFPGSVNCRSYHPAEKTAFIFGNEVDGLPERVLRAADRVVEIPMRGQKESLNVSVSVGIVLFCTPL